MEQTRIRLNHGYTEKGFAQEAYHIHLRLRGDRDEALLRDYLNTHPRAVKEYEALKLSLLKKYEFDRDGYTQAKMDFVRTHTDFAKRAQQALLREKEAFEKEALEKEL